MGIELYLRGEHVSYWVYLMDGGEDGEPFEVARHSEGGTYVMGGTNEACMNVTYNYNKQYVKVFDGASLKEAIDGKRAGDLLPWLKKAVDVLGIERSADYWEASPGNAGHTLSVLVAWGEEHPDGTYIVH